MLLLLVTMYIENCTSTPVSFDKEELKQNNFGLYCHAVFISRVFVYLRACPLQRFQKMYEAEEVEGAAEKKQLATLHQQRVQAELNEKKQKSYDTYVETVNDDDTDVSTQNDRHHK